MNIDLENDFYCELGKTIQKWRWVETEIYRLYAVIMDGANQHSVSVTFNRTNPLFASLTSPRRRPQSKDSSFTVHYPLV